MQKFTCFAVSVLLAFVYAKSAQTGFINSLAVLTAVLTICVYTLSTYRMVLTGKVPTPITGSLLLIGMPILLDILSVIIARNGYVQIGSTIFEYRCLPSIVIFWILPSMFDEVREMFFGSIRMVRSKTKKIVPG